MGEDIREQVAMAMFSVPPLLFRKTRRKSVPRQTHEIDKHVTHIYFEVIRLLNRENSLRVAEIGKRLHIAKAQMTQLINKLVKLNLVKREIDPSDRRVTNISLTEEGERFITRHENNLIMDMKENISKLTDRELKELYTAFKTIERIMNKL
jgi:MarR family transcriptional regulator, organic hydroperoxide resistance regulator